MRAELHWRGRSGTALLDGVAVAGLHRGRWRERTEVVLDGRAWAFGVSRNVLTATDADGVARHSAWSEGSWRRRWHGSLDGRGVDLHRTGWRTGWRAVDPSGAEVGHLRVEGLWSARVTGEVTGSASTAVFLLWWVDLLAARGRRSTAAAAGGAGAAGTAGG